MKICLALFAALFLLCTLGCVTPVTPEQIASADYGTIPDPRIYQKSVKDYMEGVLLDPYTARYRFVGEPQKGYAYLSGTRKPPVFGYLVQVAINAKDPWGNYMGEQPFRFFIKNEMLHPLRKSAKAEVVQ